MTYLPSRPASGELLMPKTIEIVGSSTVDARQRAASVGIAHRVADRDVFQSDQGRDVAGGGFFDLHAAELVEQVHLDDFDERRLVVGLHQGDLLAGADRAGVDAADGDAADVVGPVEVRDEHLQRRVGVDFRAGHVVEHHVQQRLHRVAAHGGVVRGVAFLAGGEDVREIVEMSRPRGPSTGRTLRRRLRAAGRRADRSC